MMIAVGAIIAFIYGVIKGDWNIVLLSVIIFELDEPNVRVTSLPHYR
jgi:hypothetical protein